VLEAVAGVRSLEVRPLDEETVACTLEAAGPGAREAVARAAVEGGLGLRELRRQAPSLEEVFVRVTQGRDPAAGLPAREAAP
jgi:hypothetical protein